MIRRRLTLVLGAAALLLPMSATNSTAGRSSAPGRNGLIAFVSNGSKFDPPGSGIAVIRADGKGFRWLTRRPGDNSPAWSPQGNRLVFSRGGDLYTIRADGTKPRRLTRGPGRDSDPAWSPDARRIAFVRNDDSLYVMNANGSSARRLSTGYTSIEGVSWSPDGGTLAYGVAYEPGDAWIQLIDPDGGGPWSPWTDETDDRNPDWSPDGRLLVFDRTTWYCGGCDETDVWLSNPDGTGVRWLATGEDPSFSPDGKRFVASSVSDSASNRFLLVIDLAGRTHSLPGTQYATDPAWQPLPWRG